MGIVQTLIRFSPGFDTAYNIWGNREHIMLSAILFKWHGHIIIEYDFTKFVKNKY